MTILIPALEPNELLIKLVYDLKCLCDYDIVIVDDGSGNDFKRIFDRVAEAGCIVLTHEVNKGKGQALKTGFHYIKESKEKEGVVCADCDGQHLPKDIIKIAESIRKNRNSIVLGTRRFIGKVPLRSRFGNSLTRLLFSFISGVKIYDTQTGLRGFPRDMIPWLCNIPGDRFEYEMNMILEAAVSGYNLYQEDIKTVYLEKNKSSHFHFLRDSIRIYFPIIKFSISSILSALVDFILFFIIEFFTSNLLYSTVGARIISSIMNYIINRRYVFSRAKDSSSNTSILKYFILAVFIITMNYGVVYVYNKILFIPLVIAKVFTETTLFLLSFWLQRKFVFKMGSISKTL